MLLFRRWMAALVALTLALACATSAAAADSPEDYNRKIPQVLREGHLYAEAAILIDAQNGDVLLAKNAHVRMYPASTTKIMTLMLSLESGIALDTPIVIPRDAARVPADSSLVPVFPNDMMTFRDLLYGFMLSSGNDGANAIAVIVSGSIDAFVERMNARALELGCEGTHFANPHGYHDPDHYSTAHDLARITQAAMQNDTFRQIVSTQSYTLNIQRGSESVETKVFNTNTLLKSDSDYYYRDCIGVKTGFHSAAGQCFVGAAERDGVRLITVDLNSARGIDKWIDTIRMFNYGYTCYTAYTLEQMFSMASGQIATLKVSNAIQTDPQGGRLELKVAQISNPNYTRMVETGSDAAMEEAIADFVSRCELVITSDMTAPVSEGEIMGSLRYIAQSGEEITARLIADRDIAEQPPKASVTDIFPFLRHFEDPLVRALAIVLAALLVLLLVARGIRHAKAERRRKRIYEARRREYMRQYSQSRERRGSTKVKRRNRYDDEDDDLFMDD